MGEWRERVHVEAAALLVVDMQNDYCHADGACARSGQDVSQRPAVAVNIRRMVAAAHADGRPTVFVKTTHDATNDTPVWLARTHDRPVPICRTGTWGAEYFGVAPTEDDLQIVKHRYSAFVGTDLELTLRALGCDTVVMTGVTTDVCVDSTMRDAFMRDFHCLVLRDCTAAGTVAAHEAALDVLGRHFGWVCDSAEVTALLSR